MSNRREFLKTSLLVAGGMALGQAGPAVASSGAGLPSNIVYTKDDPGVWSKKVGSHAPIVSHEDNSVTVFTKHGMSDEHFIVRHTLIDAEGNVLGATTFKPSDEEAKSSYELPAGYKGKLYATSFCNKHDFWMTEFSV